MLKMIEQDWFFFGLMFAVLLFCLAVDGCRLWKFRRQLPFFNLFFFGTGGLIISVYILILRFSLNSWTGWLLLAVVLVFMGCHKIVVQRAEPFAELVRRRLVSIN